MKAFIKYSFVATVLAGSLGLVACNPKASESVPPVSCPAGAYCANGVVYPNGMNSGPRIGFYALSQNYPAFNGGSSMNLGPGMLNILRDAMGTCDRQSQVGGANGGLSGCGSWTSGYHDIIIMFDSIQSNHAKLVMHSYPYIDPYYAYYYSLPSLDQFFAGLLGIWSGNPAGLYNPLVLDVTVWPINNNQGFELRAYGPTGSYAWKRLIQFQVTNGHIEDPMINYTMYIDNGKQQMATVASGTMARCHTQNCGVVGL